MCVCTVHVSMSSLQIGPKGGGGRGTKMGAVHGAVTEKVQGEVDLGLAHAFASSLGEKQERVPGSWEKRRALSLAM